MLVELDDAGRVEQVATWSPTRTTANATAMLSSWILRRYPSARRNARKRIHATASVNAAVTAIHQAFWVALWFGLLPIASATVPSAATGMPSMRTARRAASVTLSCVCFVMPSR